MIPSAGRIVHYVSHGTPVRPDGSQAYASECRAAIVTEVTSAAGPAASLCVLNPTGLFFNQDVAYHDGKGSPGKPDCPSIPHEDKPFRYCGCGWTEDAYKAGSWHWPERTE